MTTSTSTAGSKKTQRSEPAAPRTPAPPARTPAPPARAPSAELLEFLGEFADDGEGFVDPLELEDASLAEGAAPEPAR